MADDLLDEWRNLPAASQPAPAAPSPSRATAAPSSEDLLDEWRAAPSSPAPSRAVPLPAPSSTSSSQEETLPQWVNRISQESHGHGAEDAAGHRADSWGDWATRQAASGVRGVGDFADTLAKGISHSIDAGASTLAAHGVLSPESAAKVADWRNQIDSEIKANLQGYEATKPGLAENLSRLGGQVAATAPVLGAGGRILGGALEGVPGGSAVASAIARSPVADAALKGAATGASANVLTSAADENPLATQALWGALGGGVLGGVGGKIRGLMGGAVDRETAELAQKARDFGIPLRLDQISENEMVRRAGGLAQKIPGTGLAANVGEQQAALNRAVSHTIGEDSDKVTTGVWGAAKARMGSVFDQTLPKLQAYLNPNFVDRLDQIKSGITYLPDEDRRIIEKHVGDVVGQFGLASVNKAMKAAGRSVPAAPGATAGPSRAAAFASGTTPAAAAESDAISAALAGGRTTAGTAVGTPLETKPVPISGKQIQALIAHGSPLDRAINSDSGNVRYYASQLKDMLLDAVKETPTGRQKTARDYVQALNQFQTARGQYKNLKTIEDLVEKSPTGDISPALLMGAVRKSFNNMASGGGGDLADLARIGQRFLKPPGTSGTAEHQALFDLAKYGALGTGAAAGVAAFDPENWQRDAAYALALGAGARGTGALLKMGARPAGTMSRLGLSPVQRAIASGSRAPALTAPAVPPLLPYLAPRQNPLLPPPQ